MEGIQETKDALEAVNLLVIDLVKALKAKKSPVEIVASLLSDDALKSSLLKAYEGVSKVPAELSDINLAEGLELAGTELKFLPDLISALKG